MRKIKVSIAGASGYAGGELLRLLLSHPFAEVKQITSERYVGKSVYKVHPNLRKITNLKFSSLEELEGCDVLFLCLPHGETMKVIEKMLPLAEKIIDLSGDFRLNSAEDYEFWYERRHEKPDLLR